MKQPILYLWLLLIYFSATTASAQQSTLEWARRYDSKGPVKTMTGSGLAITTDAEGNIYVTGTSFAASVQSITTIKYSPSGDTLWTTTYNRPGYGEGRATAIAVDNKGGVYVTGTSYHYLTDNDDFLTIGYNASDGEVKWAKTYGAPGIDDNDEASDIAVDDQGGVYVTGTSNGDFITIRYEALDGEQKWAKYHYGSGYAKAIAVDNKGSVYVTGTSQAAFLTIRYNTSDGEMRWAKSYENPGEATAIALDTQGGVYVTGTSQTKQLDQYGNFISDFLTIRHDASDGEVTWAKTYNGTENRDDLATAIAVDNQGGVYVTGTSQTEQINQYGDIISDYHTIGYNASDGEVKWAETYNSIWNGDDRAMAIAVDNQGGVYVTGTDYVTLRYKAATGDLSWATGFNSRGSQSNNAISVAVDAEGNSYVTGTSANLFTSAITTIKYSPSGDTLWVKTYKGTGNSQATAIALDNQGGVYVTGNNYSSSSSYDYLTIRYNASDGKQEWAKTYNSTGSITDFATAMAVDNKGGVYVTGYSYSPTSSYDYLTIRYNTSDGELKWHKRYNGAGNGSDVARAIALDNEGGVYVTGYSNGETGNNDFATIRYNAADGKEKWAKTYSGSADSYDRATAIAVDNQGGVYVTGTTDAEDYDEKYLTIRYNATDGEVKWAETYNSPESDSYYDRPTAIAVDNHGGVYVTGSIMRVISDVVFDYSTVCHEASDGEVRWAKTYNRTVYGDNRATAIAVDNKGGVYVTGSSLADWSKGDKTTVFSTLKYAASDGEQLWQAQTEGPRDGAQDLALDYQGNVIITGNSYSSQKANDFLTVKYSQNGECPVLTEAEISGYTTVSAGRAHTRYSVAAPGAASFDWRITAPDGSAYTSFSGQGTSTIKVNWPGEPEVYQVSVSYAASENCPTTASTKLVFVYDTGAGFVTGGGWSESPANQDYELMQKAGRAYWAFGASYKEDKHRDANQGDPVQGALLLLLEGGYTFRATSVQEGSLVIAGERAYFTGTGTLSRKGAEDERRLAFLLSAVDGQLERPREKDRLRLVIWQVDEDGKQGDILYDNQLGCGNPELALNARACPEISRGSVVIHRKGLKEDKKHKVLAEQGLQQLEAYPTAFSGQATLSFVLESDGDYTLELYDLKGALVRQIAAGTARAGELTEHGLEAQGLQEGLYLVRLNAGTQTQTVKVIVQR